MEMETESESVGMTENNPTDTGRSTERSDNQRTIGHGIIFAYTTFAAVNGAFVIAGHLEAWRGIVVLGFAFLVLFLGDIGIQRADMNDGRFL